MIDKRRSVLLVVFATVLLVLTVSGPTPTAAAEVAVERGFAASGQIFSPSEGVFLQEGESESAADEFEAEAEGESEAESDSEFEVEAGAESEGESESEFELSAEEEAAEEAAEEDEFDSDIELDESDEAESDAETEQTLQSYAESSGAVDSESLSDAEHALESLSSAVAVSEAEAEMDAEKAGGKSKSKKGGKNKKSKKAVALSGMKMSQLNLRDDKGEGIKINLAQGKGRYSMGVNAAGVFGVDMEGRNILSVSGKSGMVRARGDVTVWNTLSAGSLTLNQVPQWKLVRQDTFERFQTLPKRPVLDHAGPKHQRGKKAAHPPVTVTAADAANAPKPPPSVTTGDAVASPAAGAGAVTPLTGDAKSKSAASKTDAAKSLAKKARGWLYDDVIRCNGFSMLSAKPGRSITTKYKKLPKHTQIRITATVHFIDDWQGETGWLKLNGQYVWTESHDQKSVSGKFSMCGSELYPESRFSAPIDVIWPHKSKKLTLALGSNLDEGSDARFAVSNVAIYTRDTTRKKKKLKAKAKTKKVCKTDPKSKKKTCKEVPIKPAPKNAAANKKLPAPAPASDHKKL